MPQMPKKVAILSSLFGDIGVGGAELALYNIALGLKNKYEVHVITSHESEIDKPRNFTNGIKMHFLKSKGLHNSKYKLDFFWEAWRTLVAIKPDVCIIKTVVFAPLISLYVRLYGKKAIYHLNHDKEVIPKKIYNFTTLLKAIFQRISLHSLKRLILITQTDYQRDQLEKNFGIKSVMLRDGYVPPRYKVKKAEPPLILWLANLRREKRVDLLLELIKKVKNVDCHFVVAGKPLDAGCLETLQQGLQELPNLSYLGPVPHDQAVELVGQATALINVSDNEGFPLAFIEAWAWGTPTVALNFDPDNLITRYQLGFRSGTLDNMARDLKQLLSDAQLYRQLSENAQNYAQRYHSHERYFQELDRLIGD